MPEPQKTHGMDYVAFGKRIAKLRESRNLSQAFISHELGIPQSTYAGYETGKRRTPLAVVIQLSKYFHVSTDYLLKETPHIETIAAHYEGNDFTKEELIKIEEYKELLKRARNAGKG